MYQQMGYTELVAKDVEVCLNMYGIFEVGKDQRSVA